MIIVLVILASIFNVIMDLSSEDLFKNNYWNKNKSWTYKWKNGNISEGEAFPFSTTILVFLTDGWHLMQFFFHTCWQLAIALQFDHWLLWFFVIKILFSACFEVYYSIFKDRLKR